MRYLILLLSSASIASAQVIAYESFSGMPTGGGIAGSGADTTGWTDTGWQQGGNNRFSIVQALPTLEHQISGGALILGGSSALRLSTGPEPVPSGLRAFRTIPPQVGTIWFSFLLRPVSIGTGSDSFEVEIRSGNTTYARAAIQPDQSATQMWVRSMASGGSSGEGGVRAGTTYLVVFGLERDGSENAKLTHGVNTSAANAPVFGVSFIKIPPSAAVSEIGFSIVSSDVSGPATTIDIDELRVGYRYNDVVPIREVTSTVPSLQLSDAKRIRWQSESGKRYRVQFAYDLSSTWFDLGSVVQGDNTVKTVFDTSDENTKKFWRVVINP